MEQRCNRQDLRNGYLKDTLELDEQLEFLEHVENCRACWEAVYQTRKADHPNYYKSRSRRRKTRKEKDKTRMAAATIGFAVGF